MPMLFQSCAHHDYAHLCPVCTPLRDDRCRRCGLGAEPATWYCGGCWPIVTALRSVAGESFDADGAWLAEVQP